MAETKKCPLEESFETFRIATELLEDVTRRGITEREEISDDPRYLAIIDKSYAIRDLCTRDGELTLGELVSVAANICSIDCYGRMREIEAVSGAVFNQEYQERFLALAERCSALMRHSISASNMVRMSQEQIIGRIALARKIRYI